MRYLWVGLIGLGVAAALVVSAALIVRHFPTAPADISTETRSEPAAESPPAVASPAVETPAAKPDVATGNAAPDAPQPTSALPTETPSASVSSSGDDGEPIVVEFVPTMPPPVPPSAPLEIVPGGILNFRSLPPETVAQEKSGQATSGRTAGERLRLTREQSEKVRDVLLSHTIMQSELEFPLRIGGTVPSNIDLIPLPREVATAVPGYRNYSYVFTQNQLVIVITTSREIDLLIPA